MTQPTTSAMTALPAANQSELRVVATKRRPPSTFWKFSSPQRVASLAGPAMITLPCSRNRSGGTTRAASTTINRPAIQLVWRADARARECDSAEEFIEDPLPSRQVVLDRLGREEAHPEMAVLRLQRRIERRDRRIGGEVVGIAIDLLALLGDDEIDQQLGGVGMRRILLDADHRQGAGGGLHLDPIDRRALLGADHGMMVEDLQRDRVFAGDDLIEHLARR